MWRPGRGLPGSTGRCWRAPFSLPGSSTEGLQHVTLKHGSIDKRVREGGDQEGGRVSALTGPFQGRGFTDHVLGPRKLPMVRCSVSHPVFWISISTRVSVGVRCS